MTEKLNRSILTAWVLLTSILDFNFALGSEPVIDFRRQIQPMLSEHCNLCHGADESKRQGGLRLDIPSLAYKGGESGTSAISPGNSAASLLIQRITSLDPDAIMPPPHANKALSVAQIDMLGKWIDQGAQFESHWAFAPPIKITLPIATQNPIDAFVRHRLQQAGHLLSLPQGSRFKVAIHMADTVGCCRMSLTVSASPSAPRCDHAATLAMLVSDRERNPSESAAVFTAWRKSKPELQGLNVQIDEQFDRLPEHQTTVLHLAERETSAARPTQLLDRGEWDRPKNNVVPHVPTFLYPLNAWNNEPPRLAFALWLVDRRSPLAARVAVNRIWQAIFGDGLVETAEDFGTRTAIPEHSDLLDYLAVDFMENSWSQKHLIKTILSSETYQQSSVFRKELSDLDPKNRLFGRGPRFRVEAEVVRDIALAASGLLTSKLGGPSIIPPVPQNVLNYNYVVPNYWTPAIGPDRYRRAVYVFRKRSMPDPVMASFDSPNGDVSCARRVRSNTPLAALTGLNETVFVEAAQAMALRVLREGGRDDASRAQYAFRLCTSRKPTAKEHLAIADLLSENRNCSVVRALAPGRCMDLGANARSCLASLY